MAKSETKKKQRLPAAVPGQGGRFYRDVDGNNLVNEKQHKEQQAAAKSKGAKQ